MTTMVSQMLHSVGGDPLNQATTDRARAILRAMREPTEGMIDIVSRAMFGHYLTSDIMAGADEKRDLLLRMRKAAGDNWRAMIDAALEE
jgi:hypothetical protein